jgi:hypothetical protein
MLSRRTLSAYERAATRLPPTVASRIDEVIPAYRRLWGGPLNGQARRQELVKAVVNALPASAIVETGTFRGQTTAFFAGFGAPVWTTDVNRRFNLYARRRLSANPGVSMSLQDSRAFLQSLAGRVDVPDERVFFYLDAHWEADLPLREELEIIAGAWRHSAVLIDDFRVPDDPGYTFDDYGEGRALTLEYLGDAIESFVVYWPAASSAAETGARRGSVLLATRDHAAARLASLPELRLDAAKERA